MMTNLERIKEMNALDMAFFIEELKERSKCEVCAHRIYNICSDRTCPPYNVDGIFGHYLWLMQNVDE